jgi:sodium:solute symporter family protein
LLTKHSTNDRLVPFIAIASPVLCFLIEALTRRITGYQFGYELLILNGLLTFIGLYLCGEKKEMKKQI